jgi:hypothetical protein
MNAKEVAAFAAELGLPQPNQIAGSQIWAVQAKVTGKMADAWLTSFNNNNRGLRPGRADRAKADMKSGKWVVSHQGLAFDEEKQITSGQHRLRASSVSGVAFNTLVFLNCPVDERKVIDQGATRNVRDVARLGYGEDLSAKVVAVARSMAAGLGSTAEVRLTPQGTYDYVKLHQRALNFTLNCFPTAGGNNSGITASATMAAFCRASYHLEHEQLRTFAAVLVSGISQRNRDAIIIRLRDRLRDTSLNNRNSAGRRLAYQLTEAALEAWNNNVIPDQLKGTKEELFTMPRSKWFTFDGVEIK